jgi:hypothetical protein
MTEILPLQTIQNRLAQHYLTKLQGSNSSIRRGRGNRDYCPNVIEQDWGQIEHWKLWSAKHSNRNQETARLQKARSLVTAVMLWHQTGAFEQVAIWTSPRRGNPDIDRKLFDPVYARPETIPGSEQFDAALEKGKSLTLDGAVSELLQSIIPLRG